MVGHHLLKDNNKRDLPFSWRNIIEIPLQTDDVHVSEMFVDVLSHTEFVFRL